jgi:hypothetical protein
MLEPEREQDRRREMNWREMDWRAPIQSSCSLSLALAEPLLLLPEQVLRLIPGATRRRNSDFGLVRTRRRFLLLRF